MNTKPDYVPMKRGVLEQVVDAAFSTYCSQDLGKLVPALRAALKQDPALLQEPVYYRSPTGSGDYKYSRFSCALENPEPLYAVPQPAQQPPRVGPSKTAEQTLAQWEHDLENPLTPEQGKDFARRERVFAAQQADTRATAIQSCIDRLIQGGKPAEAGMLRHHFAKDLGEE